MKPKPASRFSRQPVQGKNGLRNPVMNDRWKAVLLFIARNRLVSFQDIHNHFGGDAKALLTMLRVMRGSNIGFIRVCDQDIKHRNCFRPIHYEIDDRGIVYLMENNLVASEPARAPIKLFEHSLLAAHATTSIEAGIKDCPHATLLPWDMLAKTVPAETIKLKYPFGIPCTVAGEATHSNADSPPFGIRLEFPDHIKTRYFGIEAHTDSKNHTQMVEQISKYIDIERNQQYVEHFGFKKHSYYALFLVQKYYHTHPVEWLIDIIIKLGGSKIILIKEYEANPSDRGYVLTTDWQRAGHAPLNLLK